MKRSIKKQLTYVFIGIILCILLGCIIVNGVFLEKFYISNKQSTLEEMYEQLYVYLEEGSLTTTDTKTLLQMMSEQSNISFMIQNEEGEVIIATSADMVWLQLQLYTYLFEQTDTSAQELRTTDSYEIWLSSDFRTDAEYIEMWGTFETGELFILRTPMESIQESALLANRFFLYVGTVLVLISILFIRFFARKITDPILELVDRSKEMSNLNFEAKYTGTQDNEIGELGASFNAMSDRLEQAISELKKANNQLLKDIQDKEQLEMMRTEFISSVSHELKTPIALIQGYAEGLIEGVSEDKESREFYCEVIMDEADKMNKLVKNLLELNQLESSIETLTMERFDIVNMVSGMLQSLDIMIQQKGCQMSLDLPETCFVWGDQFKIEQVIRNYLTNALNHVDGDRVIHVKVQYPNDEKAMVSVFNTGLPIPEEDIERIWEKFYKVDKARTREYGGNGIGLSIVKAIMESLHQEYGIKNYDNGVEFWFELDRK